MTGNPTDRPPRVLFVLAHMHNVRFFVSLAEFLEARGARASFVSTDYSIEREALKLGRRAPNVMHTRVPKGPPGKFIEGVSLEDVCRYVLAHPSLDVRYATLFAQADGIVRAYGQHFNRIRPDLVMSWNGTTPRIRAAMKLAEARDIPTLYFEQGNFPNTLICDPKGVNYEGLMRDFEVTLTFNRERIESFLEQLRSRPVSKKRRAAVSGSALADALLLFFVRRSPFHPTLYFDHDKTVDPPRFFRGTWRYVSRKLAAGNARPETPPPLPERFIFLPLQVHDDTQIIVHSPLIRMMEELVDETIEALPEGWDLVVKSHPSDEGRRGYAVISEMLEGPRYHFLRRGNTLELVKRSSCVVTVNSTVGLEALAMEKPVVVLGDAVYAGRRLTVDVRDLAEFPAKLAEALTFRPDPDQIKRFLDYYIFEYSWPGNFRKPDPDELTPLTDYVFTRAGGKPGSAPPCGASDGRSTPIDRGKPRPRTTARKAEPLVSVLMPAYNTARFIGRAIESVLTQTYTHWELVIVDDGSTDDTPEVVGRYTDERIRYIRTENRGPGAARNTAIDNAHGEFIALLDSDDVWFPHKLGIQMEALRGPVDVGLVYANVWRIDEEGHRLKPYRFSLGRLPIGSCLDRMLVRNGVFCTSTVVFRRDILDRTGGFNATLHAGQDWDLWRRMSMYVNFGYTARPLTAYRIRKSSISAQHEARRLFDSMIIERSFSDPEVRSRFSPCRLERLRREAAAVHLYNIGSLALRAGKLGRATASFFRSATARLYDFRQIAMFAVSLVARVPGVHRDRLLEAVRK